MSDPEIYEVFAIKYGSVQNRPRHTNFIMADPHDGNMPIDYYVWAIVNENRTIIVDTGFDHKEAKLRGREIMRLPREGAEMLGIDCDKIEDVILTHMHYDHAGTCDHFPNARFHLQELEMRYVTGQHMCQDTFRHPYSCHHVQEMVGYLYDKRLQFHSGEGQIAPGVSVYLIGGHTMGVQSVRVLTKRGWVMLASDAAHFYENMEKPSPFPIVYNVADMLAGFDTLRGLAESDKHIIPGHDPLVLARYPAPKADLEGVVVRLDVEPKS